MLNSTPEQRKELGAKIKDFAASYQPNQPEAILFMDDTGEFGYSAGRQAPAGCRIIATRGELDWFMLSHGYQPGDLADPGKLDAFAELVFDQAESS
ncbi:hypothetical protein [Longispora albida]|uniref:hypothetical protein n=1 Tax=Longispora albida TaxID=203523 RepID=UPI00035D00A4|nr:hypothetical protein [Longispora albida]